jgi:hypothetical protein
MKFKIPIEKEAEFAVEFFEFLSQNLSELKIESGKWPDSILFTGNLGKELISFIEEKGWDLAQFNPTYAQNVLNKVVFSYSKPIDQIEERGKTIFDESLNNREIKGIPGRETQAKILGAYSNLAFTIERKIQPKIEIKLIRA